MNPQNEPNERARAELLNAQLLAFFKPNIPLWSAEMRAAGLARDGKTLARIAKEYRTRQMGLSRANMSAGEYVSSDLVAVEDYLESAARDIETVLGRPPYNQGEEWKGEEP